MWPFRRRAEPPAPSLSAEDRLREAEEALASTESVKEQASQQVDFFHELRKGWTRVHKRNNLASLFEDEYRRLHGG